MLRPIPILISALFLQQYLSLLSLEVNQYKFSCLLVSYQLTVMVMSDSESFMAREISLLS